MTAMTNPIIPIRQVNGFDYSSVDGPVAAELRRAAHEIRAHARASLQAVVNVGIWLGKTRRLFGYAWEDRYHAWIKAEFDWTPRQAMMYEQIGTTFEGVDLSRTGTSMAALAILSAWEISPELKATAREAIQEGRTIPASEARKAAWQDLVTNGKVTTPLGRQLERRQAKADTQREHQHLVEQAQEARAVLAEVHTLASALRNLQVALANHLPVPFPSDVRDALATIQRLVETTP